MPKKKRKLSAAQLRKAKRRAEKLKGKPGIDNPHALARWQVQQEKKKRVSRKPKTRKKSRTKRL